MDDLLSIAEFSKLIRKPVSTIRTWRRRGNLPKEIFRTIGSTVFVKKSLFDEWISKKVV